MIAAIIFTCQGVSGIPMVAAAEGLTTTTAGNLTNDSFALEEAAKCKDVCPAITSSGFGDVSWGDANGSARSVNVQDHFGIYASASVNDTENPGGGSGWAYGAFGTSLLVPPQQGNAAGDPGWFTRCLGRDQRSRLQHLVPLRLVLEHHFAEQPNREHAVVQ